MQHLDEGTIHAWLDDALPADEAAHVAGHVATCEQCAAAVAEARGFIAGASRIVSSLDVGRVVTPTQAASRTRSRASMWGSLHLTPGRAAIAATLLIAVASTFAVRHQSPLQTKASAPGAAASPALSPARQDAIVDARPSPPSARRVSVPPTASAPATAGSPAVDAAAPAVARSEPVAPAAPVAAPQAVATVATDSVRSKSMMTAQLSERVAVDRMDRASAGATAPRGFAASAGNRALFGEGCYRVSRDSSAWLRDFPEHFALERDSLSSRTVVRSMTDDRVGTILPAASWAFIAPGVVQVSMTTANRVVSLTFGGDSLRAQARSGGRSTELEVRRVDCRP